MTTQDRTRLRYRIFPPLIYPTSMAMCIGLFFFLLARPFPLIIASYAPLALVIAIILFFEYAMPHREAWKAPGSEIRTDALYMLLVQMLLPKLLALAGLITAASWLRQNLPYTTTLWPHQWSIPLQTLLMICSVDFLRYWLHRAMHETKFLWPLHAIHHSPHRLYSLNVNRFHPLERILQVVLEALPFLALGVREEVIALRFLVFAAHGFFQHCNIELKLGPLNYLVAGPELHRWHHSKLIAESNANYGNTVVLWDLLFGTFFAPKNRRVDELGLYNRAYPLDLLPQLWSPFLPGADKQQAPLPPIMHIVLNTLLRLQLFIAERSIVRAFRTSAKHPRETQIRLLRSLLKENAQTSYGKAYGFNAMASLSDLDLLATYRRAVPIVEYEELRPFIDDQRTSGAKALTMEAPVMYNQTSGSTGVPKYIPVLPCTLDDLRRSQRMFTHAQFRACPEGFAGKIFGIVSPAVEGYLDGGMPFGSASGHIYTTMPWLARKKYVLPSEIFEIADYDCKYYAMLLLGLQFEDVTYLGSANPSTFQRLLGVLRSESANLLEDLTTGTFRYADRVAPHIAAAMRKHLRPRPARAQALQALQRDHASLSFALIWPRLAIITTWTGGSCGVALHGLQAQFPKTARIVELGYLASELRGTVTLDISRRSGVPLLRDVFFEFVERDAWDAGDRETLLVDELVSGREYYLFATTKHGLYRYHMNDVLVVEESWEGLPTLRFLQKGRGVTSITGEKLYESQLISSIEALETHWQHRINFFCGIAEEHAARYAVYIEPVDHVAEHGVETTALATTLDAALTANNSEYKAKRESNRLGPVQLYLLSPGCGEAFKRHYMGKGQREGQFKPMLLHLSSRMDFDFSPWKTL